MIRKGWDIKLRLLHWAIALTATFQQLSSMYMSNPGTQFLFPYHRIVGAVAAIVLLLFWLYSYAIYDLKMLFPWGRDARREVLRESFALFRGRLPRTGRGIGLSGFVHGLGLLALSGLCLHWYDHVCHDPSRPRRPSLRPNGFHPLHIAA